MTYDVSTIVTLRVKADGHCQAENKALDILEQLPLPEGVEMSIPLTAENPVSVEVNTRV